MSPKRFSQHIVHLSPAPALAALAALVALAAFAGLLLLLSPGPAPATAAPAMPDRALDLSGVTLAVTPTTTSLVSSNNPCTYGDSVKFTAEVTRNDTGGHVSGSVYFFVDVNDNGVWDGFGVDIYLGTYTLSGGSATSDNVTLNAGTHAIRARYTGAGDFDPSTSSRLAQQVQKISVTITLDCDDSKTYGQTVVCTATPSPTSATGVVFFDDKGAEIGRAMLDGGSAELRTFRLAAGLHRIKAIYQGDQNHQGDESNVEEVTVNKADTDTTASSSCAPSVYGQYVSFTATVTHTHAGDPNWPGATTPTGLVTFWSDDGTYLLPMGQGVLNGEGQAWFGTSDLAVADYTITASYEGDANYNASDEDLDQDVNKADTQVTVTGPGSSYYGKSVTFEATVSVVPPGAGTPTGEVEFTGWNDAFETSLVEGSGGKVSFITTEPHAVGGVTIKAEYKGDDNFNSDDGTKGHTVTQAQTTTELQDPLGETDYGQDAHFTISVKRHEDEPGSGMPTGMVTLFMAPGPPANDYMYTSGTLTFSPWDTTETVTVQVNGDTDGEPNETYFVNLSNATNADFVDGQGVGTITDDDGGAGEPNLSIDNVTVVEGNLGTVNAMFTVSLSSASGDTVTVDYATADNTANAPSDYVTTSGILTFLAGDTTQNVAVTVNGDGGPEPNETYFVNLSNPTNATIADGQGVGTITNDDGGAWDPNVLIDNVTVVEGDDGTVDAVFTVSLSSASGDTVTVDYATADDTATAVFIEEDLPDTGSVVTVVTNTLRPGEHDVWAEYGGDSNFEGSTSDTVTHTVNKADSETSLESSANPSDFGQTLTFTATVEAAGLGLFAPITPTGTVTFTLGTVGVMTGTLDGSGVASVFTNTLPAGTHEITAEYGGDTNFQGSEDSLSQRVNTIGTTTALSASPAGTSVVGQEVTFTATVKETLSGDPVTSGEVTFWRGVTELDTKTVVAGVATYKTSSLSVGTHKIKAVYNGTANFQPSTSERLSHTVTAAGSNTTLTSSKNPSVYGENVTFEATVTAVGGTPTGEVTFYAGATELGSDMLDASGKATLSTAALAVGTHEITAVYGGDANFAGSTGTLSPDQVVNKANTTTTITSDLPDPSVVGQPVLVEFTVTANAPGSGTPTGNVTVSDGTDSCTGSVASAGSCTLIPTTAGDKTLTATYAGDDNFNISSGIESHTVNPANTTTTVTSDPNPSLPTQNVTITANVTANPPGSGTPTGQVQFKSNGSDIGGPVALVGGSASVSTSFGSEDSYNITADYTNIDGNFNNSSGSTTHNVSATPADLSVTKADSPDPVNVGEDVTYIIAVANHGPESTDVTLTDTLPPEVTFVSATPSQGNPCVEAGGTVTCELGNLAGGTGSATVTIVVNVPITTPAGTVLRNTAQVSGTRPDPDLSNNTSIEETTVYRSPRLGDCNGDDAVNLADVWSIVSDIFDPTFQGTSGCDANRDQQVDAGDVPSTVLIMFRSLNVGGSSGDLNAAIGPALTMPDQVSAPPGGLATVPVTFAANGHNITSLAFSVDYDETWLALDPTDRDGNEVPDAVIFSLPGEFTASVTFDGDDADGEVDIFIGDITPPLASLSDGPIAFLILNAESSPDGTEGAVRFSLDPAASFGDTSGQSVPGTATPTGRSQHQIYLPMVFR